MITTPEQREALEREGWHLANEGNTIVSQIDLGYQETWCHKNIGVVDRGNSILTLHGSVADPHSCHGNLKLITRAAAILGIGKEPRM